MRSFPVLAVIIISLFGSTLARLRLSKVESEPILFGSTKLAHQERTVDGFQLVPNLGYVRILDTFFSPKEVADMPTEFAIINKHRKQKRIRFKTDTYCNLHGFGSQKGGPFEYNLEAMMQSEFDTNTRTIIMVPGYLSNQEEDWVQLASEQWLELDPEADIIQVSWSDSNRGVYSRAVAHTPLIARQITIFLHYLATLSETSLEDDDFVSKIHIIGHSLGAHIAGFVGQDLGGRLGRITGLDPAGPSFDLFERHYRLDQTDAKFVQVIHTNAGKMKYLNMAATVPLHALSKISMVETLGKAVGSSYNGEANTAWYGIDQDIGHVDYYANNGRVQAGCEGILHICDHNRAYEIYNEILRYEIEMRKDYRTIMETNNQMEWERMVKAGRLLAFAADDYESFISGRSFATRCDELLKFAGEKPRPSEFEYMRAFNSCTIPIDLVTPVDELVKELNSHRKVSIKPALTINNPKYYFSTLDDGRLVGDHYFVNLEINYSESRWDDKSCSLITDIELKTRDGRKEITLETTKLEASIRERQNIIIPYIYADGPASMGQLSKLAKDTLKSPEATAQDEIRSILADKISFSLTRPKTPSFSKAILDAALKMIKFDSSVAPCELVIERAELHPLGVTQAGHGAIIGIYRNENSPLEGRRLPMFSHESYRNQLGDKEQLSIGTISTSSQINLALTLQGLVVAEMVD